MPEPETIFHRIAAVGVTPNRVSTLGLAFALLTAACFAAGASHGAPWNSGSWPTTTSWWPVLGGAFFGLAAVADVLDGQLARRSNLASPFGAVFDSTLDRFGDMAVFIGCAVHFAARGNVTFVLISCLAMMATTQISYVKARAESMTGDLEIGFWQRAERMVSLIIAGLLGRVPSVLCIAAVFPMFTVARRVLLARRLLRASREPDLERFFERYLPWRQPRFAVPYLTLCAGIAVAIAVLPRLHPFFYGLTDPLRLLMTFP